MTISRQSGVWVISSKAKTRNSIRVKISMMVVFFSVFIIAASWLLCSYVLGGVFRYSIKNNLITTYNSCNELFQDESGDLFENGDLFGQIKNPQDAVVMIVDSDNGKLYTDSMLKYHVNIMIYENDIRDDNGNYFEFRTHCFRHTFGVKLTEMKLDDDSIARLLGHKDTRTIPHYRRLRNEALAEDTKAVRDEMNELLAQYRREKENAETR